MIQPTAQRMAILSGRVRPLRPSPIAAAYWLSDASVKAIAQLFRCSTGQVRKLAGEAELVMPACPVCGKPFTAVGRDQAIGLLTHPIYAADAVEGSIPVCCGPWVGWSHPLAPPRTFLGDLDTPTGRASWRGEYGGGALGEKWRRMNGR